MPSIGWLSSLAPGLCGQPGDLPSCQSGHIELFELLVRERAQLGFGEICLRARLVERLPLRPGEGCQLPLGKRFDLVLRQYSSVEISDTSLRDSAHLVTGQMRLQTSLLEVGPLPGRETLDLIGFQPRHMLWLQLPDVDLARCCSLKLRAARTPVG